MGSLFFFFFLFSLFFLPKGSLCCATLDRTGAKGEAAKGDNGGGRGCSFPLRDVSVAAD